MEIGEKIKILREERGLSRENAARRLYVDKSTLAYWESGKTIMRADSVAWAARFFGVSADWLLGLSDNRYAPGYNDDIDYSSPLERLDLSLKTYNALKRVHIDTVGQLADMTAEELSALRWVGAAALRDVRAKLADTGFKLKGE